MPTQCHPFITSRWFDVNHKHVIENEWFISEDKSSFAFVPTPDIKSIFLGSFPTYEICGDNVNNNLVEFFYGSAVNNFWPILGSIFDREAGTFEDRAGILRAHKIGITDILRKVDREPWNRSQDSCLTAIEYNDILALIKKFPTIKNIFITSGGREPIVHLNYNNRNVATWFRDSVQNEILYGFNQNGFVKPVTINEIDINLVYLYSPSNLGNRPIQGILNNHDFEVDIAKFRKIQWAYFLNKLHFNDVYVSPTVAALLQIVANDLQLTNFFEH